MDPILLLGLLTLVGIVIASIRVGRPNNDGYYFEPLAKIQVSGGGK